MFWGNFERRLKTGGGFFKAPQAEKRPAGLRKHIRVRRRGFQGLLKFAQGRVFIGKRAVGAGKVEVDRKGSGVLFQRLLVGLDGFGHVAPEEQRVGILFQGRLCGSGMERRREKKEERDPHRPFLEGRVHAFKDLFDPSLRGLFLVDQKVL